MEWISVEERLPTEAEAPNVTTYSELWNVTGGCEYSPIGEVPRFIYDGMKVPAVTHWMPLPDPPAKVGA